MEKSKISPKNNILRDIIYDETRSIRIGVAIAEENAAKESKKRRINAPLSIMEKVFLHATSK